VTHTFKKYFLFKINKYIYIYKITINIKKYINLIFFKLNIIIKSTQTQLKKKKTYVFWFWQLLYYPLLSCYFSNFLQDCPYVTLLSSFLVPFLSFSFFSLLTWVWSFVVFVPLILLLCKSFPLMICFFFF